MLPHPKESSTANINPVAALIGLLLAGALLFALMPIPRASAASSLPWKGELAAGIFGTILSVWLFAGRNVSGSNRLDVRRSWSFLIPWAMFVVWSALSYFYAPSAGWVISHTLTWATYLAIFVLFSLLLNGKAGISTVYTGLFLTACILGLNAVLDIVSIANFADSQGAIRIRYGKFAELLATILPFLAAVAFYSTGRKFILAAAGWLLGWTALMLSLSKGAFIAGVVGHIILFLGCALFSNRQFRSRTVKLAAVWLLFTIVFQAGFSLFSTIPSTTDYITGSADKTRSTSIFRAFSWAVSREMIGAHPLIGVGAGNFGVTFNDSKAAYAARHPEDRTPDIAEDYVVERSHNELLQVFAELGIVGLIFWVAGFALLALAIAGKFVRSRFQLSPVMWSCVGGMLAFGVSSMVSSFSFRAIQNGIAFFIVAAIAFYELGKSRPPAETRDSRRNNHRVLIAACTGAGCILLTVFAGSKALGEYYAYRAERTDDPVQALELYRKSIAVDDDNAQAYYFRAFREASAGSYADAASSMRMAIERGLGVSITYSRLAEFQLRSGDPNGSEATLREGLRIFPNSVFLRVKYANFLRDEKHDPAFESEMAYANSVDSRQAKGWDALLSRGSVAAYYAARADEGIARPAELHPQNAVLAYADK